MCGCGLAQLPWEVLDLLEGSATAAWHQGVECGVLLSVPFILDISQVSVQMLLLHRL